MTYNITLTNGNLLAVIPDGTINTTACSLTLIGRNYAGGYGQFQDDNYVRLLESGSNSTAPAAPLTGQLWYNSTSKTLQVYNGTTFKSISGAASQTTAPTNPAAGDLWFDTINQQLKVWTGTAWLAIGPASTTGTGAIPTTITDTGNIEHSVIQLNVNGNVVGIISQDATFAPGNAISGFSNVYPGITLSTIVNSQTPTFVGTATNANTLAGLPSSAFMSAVQNTQTTGKVQILSSAGLFVGPNGELTANVVGNTTVNLYNTSNSGNLNLGVNKNGTPTAGLRVVGSTGDVAVFGNLSVVGSVTANTEIINASEIVSGNIQAANVTVTGRYNGSGAGLSSIPGANVTGTVSLASTAANAGNLKTTAWTITQAGPNLIFQVSGNTVASLDPSGNFTTLGNIIPNGTPS